MEIGVWYAAWLKPSAAAHSCVRPELCSSHNLSTLDVVRVPQWIRCYLFFLAPYCVGSQTDVFQRNLHPQRLLGLSMEDPTPPLDTSGNWWSGISKPGCFEGPKSIGSLWAMRTSNCSSGSLARVRVALVVCCFQACILPMQYLKSHLVMSQKPRLKRLICTSLATLIPVRPFLDP